MTDSRTHELLAAQGLDDRDIAVNREGRVSETQLARQRRVRTFGGISVWLMAVLPLLACVGIGVWDLRKSGDAGIVVFMSILGFVLAVMPLGIYYAFRFTSPEKIANCKVTLIENAQVGAFLPTWFREGVYSISLNGKRYSGFAADLSRSHLGHHVNAYVVDEHRIVLALVPIE